MMNVTALKNILLAFVMPTFVVIFLLGFVYLNEYKILLYIYSVTGMFVALILISKVRIGDYENDPIFVFLGVPEEPDGLTYSVIKDYLGSISTIAFSFAVMVYGNHHFDLVASNWSLVVLAILTIFLLLYSSLCLIEFIYRSVGIGKVYKTILVGIPAVFVQLAFLEVGLKSIQTLPV